MLAFVKIIKSEARRKNNEAEFGLVQIFGQTALAYLRIIHQFSIQTKRKAAWSDSSEQCV